MVEWGLAGESPKKSGNKFSPPFTRHRTRTPAARNHHLSSRGKAPPCHFIMEVDCVWNMVTHAQKPDFVFRRNGRVHLNWRGRQFSRLLAAEVCASAVVMLDTSCSEVVWSVLATHSIRQFPLQFPSLESPCAITFQLDSKIGESADIQSRHSDAELFVVVNICCITLASVSWKQLWQTLSRLTGIHWGKVGGMAYCDCFCPREEIISEYKLQEFG